MTHRVSRRAVQATADDNARRTLVTTARRVIGRVIALLINVTCVVASSPARAQSSAKAEVPTPVSIAELAAAMRAEQSLGYNLRATSNGARLQSGVILALARTAHARDALGAPFVITADAYQAAFRNVLRIPVESLPVFVRIATEYREDLVVEHRFPRVIEAVVQGPTPTMAVRVHGGWSDTTRSRYTYDDNSGSPKLRVIHERDTRYTIVDYGDMILQDRISGVGGRATSGLLGLAFTVLGDARATQSRFAAAPQGMQVARVTAKAALFSKTQTVTVRADGVAVPGIPDGRDDLVAIETRLKRKIELRFGADSIP